MFGSYGSYSSMSATSAPMDITTSTLRAHDATCAFPSWPRRSSLSDSDSDRATSFLSDDDLFLSDPFEDDARSVSSGTSSGTASPAAAYSPTARQVSEAELLSMERMRLEAQRDYVRQLINEKERRRQQLARRQSQQQQPRQRSPKKSPPNKSKLSAMTPIAE